MLQASFKYLLSIFLVLTFACAEKRTQKETTMKVKPSNPVTTVTLDEVTCENKLVDGVSSKVCSDDTKVPIVNGIDSNSCSIMVKSGKAMVVCVDGTEIVIGESTKDNSTCTAKDNKNGTYTVSCPDGTGFTLTDGKDGEQYVPIDKVTFYREHIGSVLKIFAMRVFDNGNYEFMWHGSGFVVTDNVIMTNYHVCKNLSDNLALVGVDYHYEMEIAYPFEDTSGPYQSFEETTYTTIYAPYSEHDLCALQVETYGRKSIKLQDASNLAQGQEIMAFGYPSFYNFVATVGYVVGFTSQNWDSNVATNLVSIDAQIDGGNSGGPSIDTSTGRLVGVNAAVSFGNYDIHPLAISVEHVNDIMSSPISWVETYSGANNPPPEETVYLGEYHIAFNYNNLLHGFKLAHFGGPFNPWITNIDVGVSYTAKYDLNYNPYRINGLWNGGTPNIKWLDQIYTEGHILSSFVPECNMTWIITIPSLIVSNNQGGGNFEFYIIPYDTNHDGVIVRCEMVDISGDVIASQ